MPAHRVHSCIQDWDHDVNESRISDLFECPCGKWYACSDRYYEHGVLTVKWTPISKRKAKKRMKVKA